MDKNTMYLGIGATVVVALLVVVGMVLASGYAGTITNLQTGTQSSVDSVSDRLNALKTETDQLNATASLNLIHTNAIIPALNTAWDDLSDEISSGNTGLQNSLNTVNSNIMSELNSVNTDLSDNLNAVNSSLSNQLNTVNMNVNNTLTLVNTGLSTQLTTVYNNLHSELSSVYSSLSSSMTSQFNTLNANLNSVNASIISAITANNASIIDQLVAMNMSLQEALELLQGNVTDLEQKLWSADDSVKNDTKQVADILAELAAMQGNLTEINATLALMNETMTSMAGVERLVVAQVGPVVMMEMPINASWIWVNATGDEPFEVVAIYVHITPNANATLDPDYYFYSMMYAPPGIDAPVLDGYYLDLLDTGDVYTLGGEARYELLHTYNLTVPIVIPNGNLCIMTIYDDYEPDNSPTIDLTVVARTSGGIDVSYSAVLPWW